MRLVVVGNGPAAHRLVERMRQHGHRAEVTVLGAEHRHAYNRALLTSALAGAFPPAATTLPPLPADVLVRSGVTVTAIDRKRPAVRTADGESHGYDVLVLATGACPRLPDIPGLGGPGTHTLRTVEDCQRVLVRDGTVAVVGGGVLGVEAALALRGRGRTVHLVHSGPHLMHRQLDATGAALLLDHLRAHGVRVHLGARPVGYGSRGLEVAGGDPVPADTVLVCTGVVPRTGLARAAGLAVRHGVVVDDRLRTCDPRVHAIGDCAEYDHHSYGAILPAWEQADALARLLAEGTGRYRGSRSIRRLRAASIDVAVMGPPNAPGAESVTLSDPAGGRYARVALVDRRVVSAILIGLPHAIATIGGLYARDLPMPDGCLGVLLGVRADYWTGGELADEPVTCLCNNVTRKVLADAWSAGARDLASLAAATRATTGCGSCRREVDRLCGTFSAHEEAMAREAMA